MPGRSVGTERFLRRGCWEAAVAVPNGDGGRTSKCGLVLLGSTETDAVREPSRRCVKSESWLAEVA